MKTFKYFLALIIMVPIFCFAKVQSVNIHVCNKGSANIKIKKVKMCKWKNNGKCKYEATVSKKNKKIGPGEEFSWVGTLKKAKQGSKRAAKIIGEVMDGDFVNKNEDFIEISDFNTKKNVAVTEGSDHLYYLEGDRSSNLKLRRVTSFSGCVTSTRK